MCSTLAILSKRLPIRELIFAKLHQKITDIKENFKLPIIHILNAIGLDAISEIFIPHMDFLLLQSEQSLSPEFTSAILVRMYIISVAFFLKTFVISQNHKF